MSFRLCLVLTLIESFATICVERGVFFYAHRHLGFDAGANLWLALSFGLPYVIGALTSARLVRWLSERRAVAGAVVAQLVAHVGLGLFGTHALPLFLLNIVLGLANGAKWPIIESYVSAGRSHTGQIRALGAFNVTWAVAVPLALVFAGPANVIGYGLLFWVPAGANAISLVLLRGLPKQPEHLADDHPTRPDAARLGPLRELLLSARWLLLLGYITMWILSALMPEVFSALAVDDRLSPGLSGILDVCRVLLFLVFGLWHGWESRRYPLFLGALLLPTGFLMVAAGPSLWVVLLGEVLFGLAVGAVYFAALYLAMTVQNAAVHAGGGHEATIGGGFALGPVVGLAAVYLAPELGGRLAGLLAGVGPVIALCLVMAALHLHRARRRA